MAGWQTGIINLQKKENVLTVQSWYFKAGTEKRLQQQLTVPPAPETLLSVTVCVYVPVSIYSNILCIAFYQQKCMLN